jgi:hypothetical protein
MDTAPSRERGYVMECVMECEGAPSATFGRLCGQCRHGLARDVAALPELIAHLRACAASRSAQGERVSGSRAPAAPVNLDALDAADGLWSVLYGWSDAAADALALTGPGGRPGWHVVGRADRVRGLSSSGQPGDVAARCRWILAQLDRIAEHEFIAEMARELRTAVKRASRQFPIAESWRPIPGRCPACLRKTLRIYAPQWHGAPMITMCAMPDCGKVIHS